jgi:putative ABC transport system substrate-binding protein
VGQPPNRGPGRPPSDRPERAGALLSQDNALTTRLATRIADFTARNRLPWMPQSRERVAAGGLMSYGISNTEQNRRAASYVDKILNGAKPLISPSSSPWSGIA